MAHKSLILSALMFVVDFFSALFKELKKLNVTEEQIFDALKSKEDLVPKMAEEIAKLIAGVRYLTLKSLKLIADNISVVTQPFAKDSFFKKDGPVKLWFSDNFMNWILPEIPETVPAFEGKLTKTQLTESMYDSAILGELGNHAPFSVSEFATIIQTLLTKQLNGEAGDLLTNGYANIFYVQLEDGRVVAVLVYWIADCRVWRCLAYGLDVSGWGGGRCVFSRG